MADFTIETNVDANQFEHLNNKLKDSLWHVAIINAPYRTGNLRANIKRSISAKGVNYIYDDLEAYYVDFLERGIGRNKKHVGFIENTTVNGMLTEIVTTMISGSTTFSGIPSIQMRTDVARNYERKMARAVGLGKNQRINAYQRALFSRQFSAKNSPKRKSNEERYGNLESINRTSNR
jgi:hypothetical protein